MARSAARQAGLTRFQEYLDAHDWCSEYAHGDCSVLLGPVLHLWDHDRGMLRNLWTRH